MNVKHIKKKLWLLSSKVPYKNTYYLTYKSKTQKFTATYGAIPRREGPRP